MTAKEKRIKARLEQIKQQASAANAAAKDADKGHDLAEEAAGLGLELLEEKK